MLSANAEIRSSEARFRSLVQNASDMIIIINAEGRVTYASPSVTNIMGYEPKELLGQNPLSFVHPDQADEAAQSLRAVIDEPGVHPPKELRVRHRDGTYRWVDMTAQNLLSDPAVRGIVNNARDITDKREAEEALRKSEERFRSLVQNASDLITVVDLDTTIRYASPSFSRTLGEEARRAGALVRLLHPEDQHCLLNFVDGALSRRTGTALFEARLRHQDGSWHIFEFMGTDQRINPAIAGFVLNARDVTERRDLEEQLRHRAFHDPLTNLANRARFNDRLEHALERGGRHGTDVALLFMDVDNFKAINEGMGHSIGDAALQHVAARLRDCLRPGDTAARLGGDEFTILLEDSTLAEATDLAERLLQSLDHAVDVGDDRVVVRASIGIAVSDGATTDADALLRNADIAMYAAKEAGKARYYVYEATMRSTLLRRLGLLGDMEPAVKRGEFIVEYQPLVDLENSDIAGFEALVRWQHPRLGLLQPSEFVSIAEESGLIVPIGRHVLEEACDQARQWHDAFPREPARTMNVNVSVKQLQDPGFLPSLLEVLATTGLDPASLVLEVTESIMLQDVESTVARLQEIRRHGVRVAIDDFGTGYSSLSYLSKFPFDILKIDKSFIDKIGESEREGVLARAIIELGRTFSVEVIAEGIEDAQGLDRLRDLNCRVGQGFYFARPASGEQMSELIRSAGQSSRAA